jgi:septum formation protein
MGISLSEKLILASASPRRAELLNLLGLDFEVIPSHMDETSRNGETPPDHVLRLSLEKADQIAGLFPEALVLGADTVVVIDNRVLGKPKTQAEARYMLQTLSGREHIVYTGFSLVQKQKNHQISQVVKSAVLFKDIPGDEISWYVSSEEPYDKAGGYAVQGMGAFFIREIRGSYTNVMGLPLSEVVETLKDLGTLTFSGDHYDQGIYQE